ncbi:ethanolamine ammonia-lyase subunit EutC [Sphingomonas colocasiae]|uniref:Ethanolamine ammonia-lyase small subunit n=1 Tax=Sphingomonas colocasiae TaxID=1848973 RepID=A0ABS7PS99_9SPHN|nr:ethanolamine ammonia-lyase subunit EutC [Sphingomonas colocasiae]MBY8824213.1 ethanolamine ammonia-lyase subunit EutC [Sphingomonas colocasiae]
MTLPVDDSPAARLRAATQARIALGRSGAALPTGPMLAFQLDHACARDAVHLAMDGDTLAQLIGGETLSVRSRADTRETYLKRPDLGRALDPGCAPMLDAAAGQGHDLALVVGDGLSAHAVHAHAPALIAVLRERLSGWRIAPVVLARQARVALGDAIGERLGAAIVLMLIGERPGLSSPDSLGAYLTWAPRIGRRDSERNCVSNIRPPHGLSYDQAADRIAWLLNAARSRRVSGIALKDETDMPLLADPNAP